MNNGITEITYDGAWPCLCMGELTVVKNGVTYKVEYILHSGGRICRDDNWKMWSNNGEWDIDKNKLPDELKPDYEHILEWVRDNVDEGCCGGCI